jgi:malate synthase
MTLPEEEDFITRRDSLAREISRQRGELAQAYRQLEKPIRYTEYGMKGFAFIRQNQWVLTVAPALMGSIPSIINLVSSAFGWRKKKKAVLVQHVSPAPSQGASPTTAKKLSRVSQALMSGAEQGVRAYNLYRRIRSLIP